MKKSDVRLYTLVEFLAAGKLDAPAFIKQLESWKPARLMSLLRQFKFAANELPVDRGSLARLLAVNVAPEDLIVDKRIDGPATVDGLLHGHLFSSDPEELVMRFIKPSETGKGDIAVMGVYKNPADQLIIRRDLVFCAGDLPQDFEPPWKPEDLEKPPEFPEEEPPPEELEAARYLHVNVKLVFWIPFYPNELPLVNKILPYWQGKMDFTEEYNMKVLLATGNPDPPALFPTKQSWMNFLATNEYRGVIDVDFLLCCEDSVPVNPLADPKYQVGYTPSISSVPLEPKDTLPSRLRQDHESREALASQLVRLIKAGGTLSNALLSLGGILPSFAVPECINKGIAALEQNALRSPPGRNNPESYTQGNVLDSLGSLGEGSCHTKTLKMGIQVNNIENILYYINTCRLLPYMWGEVKIRLCCDGQLVVDVTGSAVPSKALYINNVRVGSYDMLETDFEKIKEAIPLSGGDDEDYLTDPSQVRTPAGSPYAPRLTDKAGVPVIQIATTRAVNFKDGCPAEIPKDQWLFPRIF